MDQWTMAIGACVASGLIGGRLPPFSQEEGLSHCLARLMTAAAQGRPDDSDEYHSPYQSGEEASGECAVHWKRQAQLA